MRFTFPVVIIILLLVGVGALARDNADLFPQRQDTGDVFGMVVDAKTGLPLEGALVRLEEGGLLQDSGPTTAKSDAKGRYQAKSRIGNRESHTKFRIAGVISGPLTKTRSSKTIDLTRMVVSAERPGYRRFYGVVDVGYASPAEFAIYLQPIILAPETSGLSSYARNGGAWECFDDPKLEPSIVRPGDKVAISIGMRAPLVQSSHYAVFASNPLNMLGKTPPKLKPVSAEPDEYGNVTFRADMNTPGKPLDVNGLIRVYVFRDGKNVTPSYLRPMLLQFASAAEAEPARLCDEAWRLWQDSDLAAALGKAAEAARINPGYATAQELVGRLAMKKNRPDEGLAALKKLVELRPEDYEGALATYTDALVTAGQFDEAEKITSGAFEKIKSDKKLRDKPFGNLHAVYARCMLSKGDLAVAEDHIKKAGVLPPAFIRRVALERARAQAKVNPEDTDARAALGRALADSGNWTQAVNELRAVAGKKPTDPWLRMDLAGILLKDLDRPDLALPELKAAVDLLPENAEARLALGDCYRLLGRYNEAAGNYEKAAALQPANFHARHWNGIMQFVLGNEERAVSELREIVKEGGLGREKGEQKVREQFYYYFSGESTSSLQSGFAQPEAEWDYVILDSLAVLKSQPDNAMARYNLGNALVSLGLPEAGLIHLDMAAKSLADSAEVKNALARANWKMGRKDEALALYDESLKKNPFQSDVRREMAELLTEKGEEGRAAMLLMDSWYCGMQAQTPNSGETK